MFINTTLAKFCPVFKYPDFRDPLLLNLLSHALDIHEPCSVLVTLCFMQLKCQKSGRQKSRIIRKPDGDQFGFLTFFVVWNLDAPFQILSSTILLHKTKIFLKQWNAEYRMFDYRTEVSSVISNKFVLLRSPLLNQTERKKMNRIQKFITKNWTSLDHFLQFSFLDRWL